MINIKNIETTIKILISEEIFLFKENVQLADKLYRNAGKLNSDELNSIYNLTNRDNSTKLMCDLYYSLKNEYGDRLKTPEKSVLKDYYNQIKNYNKNIFPIKNFDIYNMNESVSTYILNIRGYIINKIKELPTIAIRNLRSEIRLERGWNEFEKYKNDLDYLIAQLSLLSNRDKNSTKNIYNKMFKSGMTLSKLINFADDKQNLIGGKKFTKQTIKKIIDNDSDGELEVVYDEDNIMVVDVTGPNGIKKIGCNSLWCFTYGENMYLMWQQYSTNHHSYVIIDFNEDSDSASFMYVLIAPLERYYDDENEDEIPLYDMSNEKVYSPNEVINSLIGNRNANKIFTFES